MFSVTDATQFSWDSIDAVTGTVFSDATSAELSVMPPRLNNCRH